MSSGHEAVNIRRAEPSDVVSLCAILNAVIEIGGTTAFEVQMTLDEFDKYFVKGPNCLTCFVAESVRKEVIGFQALARHPALPPNWADIGTFARTDAGRSGVGTALFAATKKAASGLDIVAINATIRADNASGIPYYDRMGFETYHTAAGVRLRDGTPVDRISKRYVLRRG